MLQFVLGTSGSGKSRYIRAEVARCVAAGKKAILLVPEQFSYESEREISRVLGVLRSADVEVLSFTRLANRIFREYGGLAGTYVDDASRTMLMSVALEQCGDFLQVFSRYTGNTAFLQEMVALVNELKNGSVVAQDLRCFAKAGGALDRKLSDIALIYETYQALVESGYHDEYDDLRRACEMLEDGRFFDGYMVFVDAFSGFSASELRLLEFALRRSEKLTVALCTDSLTDEQDGIGLFSAVQHTAAQLTALAKKNAIAVMPAVRMQQHSRFKSEQLAHLEANLMRPDPQAYDAGGGDVTLNACRDPYDEAVTAARAIVHLVREEGYRYRDIVVIARNTEPYESVIETVFEQYGIPIFWDRRADVGAFPLMTLVMGAVRFAAESMGSVDLLRLAKTGLLGIEETDIARLERYSFVWELTPGDWLHPFTRNPAGFAPLQPSDEAELEQLEKTRRELIEPLLHLRDRLRRCDGRTFAGAVFQYVQQRGVAERMRGICGRLQELGQQQLVADSEAVWQLFCRILDQFAAALGEMQFSAKRLYQLFALVVQQADVGTIPQVLDAVTVGSADRIRPHAPRAAVVLGLNEGIFPPTVITGGILNDREREQLHQAGLELSFSVQQRTVSERFYAYNALCCMSEKLYASYAERSSAGEPLRPSWLFNELVTVSGAVLNQQYGQDWMDGVVNLRSALAYYVAHYPLHDLRQGTLRALLLQDPQTAGLLDQIDRAVRPSDYRIVDHGVAQRLFGRNMTLSPTRIDRYYSCPFAYFCANGLGIRKIERAHLSPIQSGSVIHYVLERMIAGHGVKQLAGLDARVLREEIRSLLEQYLHDHMGGELDKTKRFQYLYYRLAASLGDLLLHIVQELSQSRYEPVAFEQPVGPKQAVQSLVLRDALGGTVTVEGVIDRVDLYRAPDGQKYIRVIDYKSGSKRFSLSDVLYGLNIQMLVYLFSACSSDGIFASGLPGGILYLPAGDVSVGAERTESESEIAKKIAVKRRMNGLLLADEQSVRAMEPDAAGVFIPAKIGKDGHFDRWSSVATLREFGALRRQVERLLVRMADELHDGNIAALPVVGGRYNPCSWCDYRAVCRRQPEDPQVDMLPWDTERLFTHFKAGDPL